MTHKEIFTAIYGQNIWGGSGGGSSPENTVEYRALLKRFLKEKNIKYVVDYGCGDWSFSRHIDWSIVTRYLGVEVVDDLVINNQLLYGKTGVSFTTPDSFHLIKGFELIIIKDVLQHWSNETIDGFMENIPECFKYILITNTSNQKFDNQNLVNQFRPLSAKFEPLKKYNPEILATIHTTETKEVSLITR